MKRQLLLWCMLCAILALSACKKEAGPELQNEKGQFVLEFEHQVDGKPLVLGTQSYKNALGQDFSIDVFKYYISNIKLTNAKGEEILLPESYILVDAQKATTHFVQMKDIPTGDYTQIEFLIGVDKARNHAGAQTGALDPSHGMFWTWNSGYIFVKLEGKSAHSTQNNKQLTFHIGGVIEPHIAIRSFKTEINPANPLRIRQDKNPDIHFMVNAASLFKGVKDVDFSILNYTMGGAAAIGVADNYAKSMFRLDHIHN